MSQEVRDIIIRGKRRREWQEKLEITSSAGSNGPYSKADGDTDTEDGGPLKRRRVNYSVEETGNPILSESIQEERINEIQPYTERSSEELRKFLPAFFAALENGPQVINQSTFADSCKIHATAVSRIIAGLVKLKYIKVKDQSGEDIGSKKHRKKCMYQLTEAGRKLAKEFGIEVVDDIEKISDGTAATTTSNHAKVGEDGSKDDTFISSTDDSDVEPEETLEEKIKGIATRASRGDKEVEKILKVFFPQLSDGKKKVKQKDIASCCGLHKGTVSSIFSALLALGYIKGRNRHDEEVESEKYKTNCRYQLTRKGRRLLTQLPVANPAANLEKNLSGEATTTVTTHNKESNLNMASLIVKFGEFSSSAKFTQYSATAETTSSQKRAFWQSNG